jgi:hypothetical protein
MLLKNNQKSKKPGSFTQQLSASLIIADDCILNSLELNEKRMDFSILFSFKLIYTIR